MLVTEISKRYPGHEEFAWIMLKNPNLIEHEDGTKEDFGPYNGWQTWTWDLNKGADMLLHNEETGDFSMIWIPYWGNNEEEGAPKELFDKFYHGTLSDGTQAESGGWIKNLVFEDLEAYVDKYEDVFDDDGNLIDQKVTQELTVVGQVLTNYDFDEDSYNRYELMQPSRVPGIIDGKVSDATTQANATVDAGTVPNSVAVTCITIDGEEVAGTPNYSYNEVKREALNRAVTSVTNGAPSAKITFDNCKPIKMDREQVLRMYLEMELFARKEENYCSAYKSMVLAHKDDDRDQAKYLDAHFTYGMELEGEYLEEFNANMADDMAELQAMNEYWGLDV